MYGGLQLISWKLTNLLGRNLYYGTMCPDL